MTTPLKFIPTAGNGGELREWSQAAGDALPVEFGGTGGKTLTEAQAAFGDISAVTETTLNGSEQVAVWRAGFFKTTVSKICAWIVGRANTWSQLQTFSMGVAVNGPGIAMGAGAPAVKQKLITFTTGSVSSVVQVAHGLNMAKILGFEVLVNAGAGFKVSPLMPAANVNYQVELGGTLFFITLGAGAAAIPAQPGTILVTYTD